MRVVIDTNVLISALLSETSAPSQLIALWRQGRFQLLTSADQLDELRRVTRYPRIRERLSTALAGRLVNQMRDLALVVREPAAISVSPDPNDDYLLALAAAGKAAFVITGDKRDLLALRRHEETRILTVRDFLNLHKRQQK